jgi:hypothetical protein
MRGAQIQVFTEPSAVSAVTAVGGAVFVGTSQGLDRWEVGSGKRRRLGVAEGVMGSAVRALGLERGGKLWFATDAGVGRLDLETDKAEMMPAPPAPLATALSGLRALEVDPKGGVWVGATSGLFHADVGGWSPTSFRQEVTALHPGLNGALWIGTRDGVVERNVGGVFSPVKAGITIRTVVAIAEGPDGAAVVVGNDDEGKPRIAAWLDGGFTTYRLSVDAAIGGAAHREGGLVLATSGRLLTLYTPDSGAVGLVRNGVSLLHVAGKRKRPPYVVGTSDLSIPPEITALAASGTSVYLGTRTLGTTRLSFEKQGGNISHLRPRELVSGARSLTVACASRDECFVATGGIAAWRYDGRSFAPLAVDKKPVITLAVVRSPQGEVLALYREPSERRVHVARLVKGSFASLTELKVETPSGATLLSFAKFAPDGLLWLGLSYVDADGDTRPYGVAIVNLDLAAVSYHREADKKTGVLPVPNDVVDVAFQGDETWFASGSGAARLKGERIQVWTEADALKSEILHGIVATEGGVVFVASTSGVGEFDGTRWTYPPALSVITNALARGLDGKLWLATDRGLLAWDGAKSMRYDRRNGLLDERIFDVAVDMSGRVWARGVDGLSLLTP